jgi:hypothetical protein
LAKKTDELPELEIEPQPEPEPEIPPEIEIEGTPIGNLRNRIGIASFENRTFVPKADFVQIFQNDLVSRLQTACPDIQIITPNSSNSPSQLAKLPKMQNGRIDNFTLAKIGRDHGLNAVITGSLMDIRTTSELLGLPLFKDIYHFIRIMGRVEVYDIETGTKMLDQSFISKKELDEVEFDQIQNNRKIDITLFRDTLLALLEEMVDPVADIVNEQPWKGHVAALSGDKVTLSSGSNAGLASGNVFEIYEKTLIEGPEGHRYYIPGPKAGLIQITDVKPDKAEAVLISNEKVSVESSIRPRM